MSLFLEGVVIGLAVAAPVGPIGVLCIRRTLAYGRTSGFVSGLGAATADAAYSSVAALGLTFVTDLLVDAEAWLRLGGGVFLVFLGVKTFLSRPAEHTVAAGRGSLPGAYASTLALTLANPSTILSFAAIFAGLGAGSADGGSNALLLVPGVFLGSTSWWFVLSGATSLLRAKLPAGALRWVNRLSGAVLAGFGLVALSGLGG
jgi:threonine/homoserine/homoserine lactone efflux protein